MLREILFVVTAAVMACGQTPALHKADIPFNPKRYPASKFRVSRKEYPFGEVTVRVVNVKNIGDEVTNVPHFCGAWVEVLKDSHLLRRFSCPDIEPVGFSFGAFVPKLQPEGYFAVAKEGDYDGRLLLVAPGGKVVDLPGGFYFVTRDNRFLVSEYSSDSPGFTVFDLVAQRSVLKEDADVYDWFRDGAGYFFSLGDIPVNFKRLDLKKHRMIDITVKDSDLKVARKVQFDFDPRPKQDCVSTPQ
jgi:hypothetical protein